MVHALFLSVFCDIHEESFSIKIFFIYIYVGLQSSVAYPPLTMTAWKDLS